MKDALVQELIEIVCSDYKVSTKEAEEKILDQIDKNSGLKKNINEYSELKKFKRTREYKVFVKQLKKKIYFDLRTYQKENNISQESHVSTLERMSFADIFFNNLDSVLKETKYVLDLGGGMFPVSFPFEKYQIEQYIWIDKDKLSYEKLTKFKEEKNLQNLILYPDSIGEKPWSNYLTKIEEFDLVLMLKLIPVITRQDKQLLEILSRSPGKRFLVTGSKQAMVKKTNIYRRERKVINNFILKTGKKVISTFDYENEFGYLLE